MSIFCYLQSEVVNNLPWDSALLNLPVTDDQYKPLLKYVQQFKERLKVVGELARKNLEGAQTEMKTKYDRKTLVRSFEVGDLVLVFHPIHQNPLTSTFFGQYANEEKKSGTNYIVETPDRRKSQRLVNINNLRSYYSRGRPTVAVTKVVDKINFESVKCNKEDSDTIYCGADFPATLKNSDTFTNLPPKLQHLTLEEEEDVRELIEEFKRVCKDVPSPCNLIKHYVVLCENTRPIKQAPYRIRPGKRKVM